VGRPLCPPPDSSSRSRGHNHHLTLASRMPALRDRCRLHGRDAERLRGRPPSQLQSHSPASSTVRGGRPGWDSPRYQVRTVADLGEHTPADLESMLGASPRGFESCILRISPERGTLAVPSSPSSSSSPWWTGSISIPSRRSSQPGSRRSCGWSRARIGTGWSFATGSTLEVLAERVRNLSTTGQVKALDAGASAAQSAFTPIPLA
jgi:hypothetical protein